MAIKDIIQASNVLVVDIRDTLNANGGSVGDYPPLYFRSVANINKWAKNKPMRHSTDIAMTENQKINAQRGLGTYKILNDSYVLQNGYNSVYAIYLQHISSNYDFAWLPELPRGSSYNEPCRLADFVGYVPMAESPFLRPTGTNRVYLVESNTESDDYGYLVLDIINRTAPSGSIGLSEMNLGEKLLGEYYAGVLVCQYRGSSISIIACVTSASIINNATINSTKIRIDASGISTGQYYFLFFLSSIKIEQTSSINSIANGAFYPIDNPRVYKYFGNDAVYTHNIAVAIRDDLEVITLELGSGAIDGTITLNINNSHLVSYRIDGYTVYMFSDVVIGDSVAGITVTGGSLPIEGDVYSSTEDSFILTIYEQAVITHKFSEYGGSFESIGETSEGVIAEFEAGTAPNGTLFGIKIG